jgi:pimeloyl-ACP methyl ester carboxylesterase
VDTIEAGGHRIAYERRGDGPPVVLLHGYGERVHLLGDPSSADR